jgi:D-aminopeptidase
MPLEKTRQLIKGQAEAAVRTAGKIQPFAPEGPFMMQLGFKFVESAEKAAMIPCLRREDMYTISYQADNLIEIRKALLAAIALADR